MNYPQLANWIRFKRVSEDEYIIRDLLFDEQFRADTDTVRFVRQLDGKTDPYSVDKNRTKEEIDELICDLTENNIIRDRRFYSKHLLYLFVTLWKPRVTSDLRLISYFINAFLMISWLPLLIFAIYRFICEPFRISDDFMFIGSITGLLLGMVMHELGHMFACLGYGGGVFEAGIMLQFFMPGAYVLLNSSNIKKRMRRIQILAAGIEMNLLLTGVFLLLSSFFEPLSGFFLGAAVNNAFIALLNLTFLNGIDGMKIMEELMGTENIVERAKSVIKSKAKRRKLSKEGLSGKATLAVCYIIRCVQITYPVLIILNIVGVIFCFL